MKKLLNNIGKWSLATLVLAVLVTMVYWNVSDEKAKVDKLRKEMFSAYEVAEAKSAEVNAAKLELPQKYCLEDSTYCAPNFPQAKNLN